MKQYAVLPREIASALLLVLLALAPLGTAASQAVLPHPGFAFTEPAPDPSAVPDPDMDVPPVVNDPGPVVDPEIEPDPAVEPPAEDKEAPPEEKSVESKPFILKAGTQATALNFQIAAGLLVGVPP